MQTDPTMNRRHRTMRRLAVSAAALGLLVAVPACGSSDSGSSGGSGSGGGGKTGVALILKNTTNPFFVSMQESAETYAKDAGVDLTVSAGKEDGDEATQITAIENAVSAGDKGILITPNGPGVNDALNKARDAGLYVIALDTPPDPPETVDITFATDNFLAGQLIGQWTKAQLDGKDATIAMLDLFDDKIVSVDLERDQGFLDGMGIEVPDAKKNGSEAETGDYDGGGYTIACHEATQGAEDGGRTAMENCLSKNPDINVVYTINEPAAVGAKAALEAAGVKDALIVSVDGGCDGVQQVKDGVIGATSQQYPGKMASKGIEAIVKLVEDGTKPETTDGLDFFNTGVALVTDTPADGVESIDTTKGLELCWG